MVIFGVLVAVKVEFVAVSVAAAEYTSPVTTQLDMSMFESVETLVTVLFSIFESALNTMESDTEHESIVVEIELVIPTTLQNWIERVYVETANFSIEVFSRRLGVMEPVMMNPYTPLLTEYWMEPSIVHSPGTENRYTFVGRVKLSMYKPGDTYTVVVVVNAA